MNLPECSIWSISVWHFECTKFTLREGFTTGNSSQLLWIFSFTLHLSSHYFIYHMNTSVNNYHLFVTCTCAINGKQFSTVTFVLYYVIQLLHVGSYDVSMDFIFKCIYLVSCHCVFFTIFSNCFLHWFILNGPTLSQMNFQNKYFMCPLKMGL